VFCRTAGFSAALTHYPDPDSPIRCVVATVCFCCRWSHIPLYHSYHKCDVGIGCPICSRKVHNLSVHMRNRHGPVGRGEMESDDLMEPPTLHAFAFVICRDPSTGERSICYCGRIAQRAWY
jgi:hypothetical protein